jgi:hypothetical protein
MAGAQGVIIGRRTNPETSTLPSGYRPSLAPQLETMTPENAQSLSLLFRQDIQDSFEKKADQKISTWVDRPTSI